MANIHEHAVLSDVLERKGSGFVAHHGDDFMMANNAHWIGFSLEIGPDGALYVLDWHDGDICGQDILHKDTGRVFRIAPKQSLAQAWPGRYGDLRTLTDAQLVALQESPSDWHARRARVILQGRAAAAGSWRLTPRPAAPPVHRSANADWRLRAMWGCTSPAAGRRAAGAVARRSGRIHPGLGDSTLTETGTPAGPVLEKFVQLARGDESAVVRLYLASALQRIDKAQRWPLATELMARDEDADDENIPKLVWLAIEPLVKDQPAFALERASQSNVPLISRFIARRAVDAERGRTRRRRAGEEPASAGQPARRAAGRPRRPLRSQRAAQLGGGLRAIEARRSRTAAWRSRSPSSSAMAKLAPASGDAPASRCSSG